MGLESTFKKAAKIAFKAAGDIPKPIWYYAYTSSVYNVSAGTLDHEKGLYQFDVIFSDYRASQVDGKAILNTDIKATAPQNDVIFTPGQHDTIQCIEAGSSVIYEVLNFEQDAAGALWVFQLRKS